MGKTSQKEEVKQIDPQMRAEAGAQMNLGRDLAGMGYNPYEGNTIAAFTPAQSGAFDMADAASAAFGMQGGAGSGVPTGTAGANGIYGFSPESVMQQESPISSDLQSQLDQFYKTAGTHTPEQPALQAGGGGKK